MTHELSPDESGWPHRTSQNFFDAFAAAIYRREAPTSKNETPEHIVRVPADGTTIDVDLSRTTPPVRLSDLAPMRELFKRAASGAAIQHEQPASDAADGPVEGHEESMAPTGNGSLYLEIHGQRIRLHPESIPEPIPTSGATQRLLELLNFRPRTDDPT